MCVYVGYIKDVPDLPVTYMTNLISVDDPWFCSPCITNILHYNKILNEAEFMLSSTNLASIENSPMVFKPFSFD